MSNDYGIQPPAAHRHTQHQRPARYLVVIDAGGGGAVARLFLDTREQVAEFDAASEEVAVMSKGLAAEHGADGPEWDTALDGHSAAERTAAAVYTLDV